MSRSFSRGSAAASHLAEPLAQLTMSSPSAQQVAAAVHCSTAPMFSSRAQEMLPLRNAASSAGVCTFFHGRMRNTACPQNSFVRSSRAVRRRYATFLAGVCPGAGVSVWTAAAVQRRLVSQNPPSSSGSADAGRAVKLATPSSPPQRRFAHRRRPAKRAAIQAFEATPANKTDDTDSLSAGTAAAAVEAPLLFSGQRKTGVELRINYSARQASVPGEDGSVVSAAKTSGQSPRSASRQGREGDRADAAATSAGGCRAALLPGTTTTTISSSSSSSNNNTNKAHRQSSSAAKPRQSTAAHSYDTKYAPRAAAPTDFSGFFRLPAQPDTATATPASLCSYMLTLRRNINAGWAGSYITSAVTRRTATLFLRYSMPQLMQCPPGKLPFLLVGINAAANVDGVPEEESSVAEDAEAVEVEEGKEEGLGADAEVHKSAAASAALLAGNKAPHALALQRAGTGTVPWTTELAEATLVTAVQAELNVSSLWVAQAALEFLLHEAAAETSAAAGPLGVSTSKCGAHAKQRTCVGEFRPNSDKDERQAGVSARRVGDRARLALALLQTQEAMKKRRRITKRILQPVCRRLLWRTRNTDALQEDASAVTSADIPPSASAKAKAKAKAKAAAAATAGTAGAAAVSGQAPIGPGVVPSFTPPKLTAMEQFWRQAISRADTYLYAHLLPSLFDDLLQFCAMVERRYDTAVPTAHRDTVASREPINMAVKGGPSSADGAVSSSSLPLHDTLCEDRLPSLLQSEQETFSVLLSVLSRVLNARGIARESPEAGAADDDESGGFRFRPYYRVTPDDDSADATAALPINSPMCGLPLRSFVITLASVAATIERKVGPRTGVFEQTVRRSRTLREVLGSGVDGEADSGGGVSAEHDAPSAHARIQAPTFAFTPSSSSSRFQQRREPRTTPPSPATDKSTADYAQTTKQHTRSRRGRETGGAHATSSTSAPTTKTDGAALSGANFNAEVLVSVLKFCYHDHALQLLVSKDGAHQHRSSGRMPSEHDSAAVMEVGAAAPQCAPFLHTNSNAEKVDYVNQIAQAELKLLQISLHWAPLFRTTQLPAVVHALTRVLKPTGEPSVDAKKSRVGQGRCGINSSDVVTDEEFSVGWAENGSSDNYANPPPTKNTRATQPAAATFDSVVHQRVSVLFFRCYPDAAAFRHVMRRLLRSTATYYTKQVPGTIVSTATEFDHIFSQWPRVARDGGGSAMHLQPAAVPRGKLCYPIPSSCTSEVMQFLPFMEESWTMLLRKAFWSTIPSHFFFFHQGRRILRRAVAEDPNIASSLARERKSLMLRVLLPKDEAHAWKPAATVSSSSSSPREAAPPPPPATGSSNTTRTTTINAAGGAADVTTRVSASPPSSSSSSSSTLSYTLFVPPFLITWFKNRSAIAADSITPDMLAKLLRATNHLAHYLAIPSSGGRISGAAPMLLEWRATPFSSHILSGSMLAFFVVQENLLYISAQPLPKTLMAPMHVTTTVAEWHAGPSQTATTASSAGVSSTRTAAPAASSSPSPFRFGEEHLWETLQSLVPGPKMKVNSFIDWMLRSNPLEIFILPGGRLCSKAALTLRGTEEGCDVADDAVWLLSDLRKRFVVWLPTWEENCFSLADIAAVLRVVHLKAVAETSSLSERATLAPNVTYERGRHDTERVDSRTWDGFGLFGSQWRWMSMHEWIARIAHRVLFAPQDRAAARRSAATSSTAQEPARKEPAVQRAVAEEEKEKEKEEETVAATLQDESLFDHDPVASLEVLVMLYLSLLASLVNLDRLEMEEYVTDTRNGGCRLAKRTSRSGNVNHGGQTSSHLPAQLLFRLSHFRSPKLAAKREKVQYFSIAFHRSLARCETVLRERLSALRSGSLDDRPVWSCVDGLDDTEGVAAVLQLCLVVEQAWRGDTTVSSSNSGDMLAPDAASVPRQLRWLLQKELHTRLRACSLRDMAAMLSDQLWWTARRQRELAAVAAMPTARVASSWVEETLLDVLEEKLYGADQPAEVDAHHVFAIYEWVLMPLYVRVELRRQQQRQGRRRPTDASSSEQAHPVVRAKPVTSALDDFTVLEDVFVENGTTEVATHPSTPFHDSIQTFLPSDGRKATPPDPTAITCAPLQASIEVQTGVLLERALNALVSHCESFDALLHVVRYLFLSHPATLSTAPDTAAQLDAATAAATSTPSSTILAEGVLGSQAWMLPLQLVHLSPSTRERYVDTLYRLFLRLVYLGNTSLQDTLELLHVLWLADPAMSRPNLSASAASSANGTRGAARVKRSGEHAATSQAWPSLFQLCADFIADALDSDAGSSGTVPPVICGLRDVLEQGLLVAVQGDAGYSDGFNNFATLQLPPTTVLLFLQSLVAQVRVERAAVAAAARGSSPTAPNGANVFLTAPQSALLQLLEPFILFTIATSELMYSIPKEAYLPLLLDLLSELDPRMVLTVIQAAFIGRCGRRSARGFPSRAGQTRSSTPRTRKRLLSSARVDSFEERARRTSAIASAIVMVANQAQASSQVWAMMSTANDNADTAAVDDDNDAVGNERNSAAIAVDDELPYLRGGGSSSSDNNNDRPSSEADNARGRASNRPFQLKGGAYHRAIDHLCVELYFNLNVPPRWQPLRFMDPAVLVQLLQLSQVRSDGRLARVLSEYVLRLVVTKLAGFAGNGEIVVGEVVQERVTEDSRQPPPADERPGSVDGAGAACASLSGNSDLPSLTPVGAQLLRRLPLPLWRELFYRHVFYPSYVPYMRAKKLLRLHSVQQRQRDNCWRRLDEARAAESTRPQPTPADGGEGEGTVSERVKRLACGATTGLLSPSRAVFSLAAVLLSLDATSARTLATAVMSPTVLLTVTADLLQLRWWNRRSCGAKAAEPPVTPLDSGGDGGRSDSTQLASSLPSPSSSSSYTVLMQYASSNSVLRETALQPYLQAVCQVLDQLASSRQEAFFAVLQRDAEWKQYVKDGRTAPSSTSASVAQPQQSEPCSSGVTAVSNSDAGGFADSSADSDSSAPRRVGDSTNSFPAVQLVLDWQPIVRLLRVLYAVDPGVMERQVRDGWWSVLTKKRSDAVEPTRMACTLTPAVREQRDVFHDGIDAVLQRVGEIWQTSSSYSCTDHHGRKPVVQESGKRTASPSHKPPPPPQQPSPQHRRSPSPPRLLVMNLHMVLDLYSPYILEQEGQQQHHHHQIHGSHMTVNLPMTAPRAASAALPPERGAREDDAGTGHNSKATVALEWEGASKWLAAGCISGWAIDSSDAASSSPVPSLAFVFNDSEASYASLVSAFRTTANTTATTAIPFNPLRAREVDRRRRQAALLCRAGLLITADEARQRCAAVLSRTSNTERSGDDKSDTLLANTHCYEADANAYWQARQARIHQRVFECAFGVLKVFDKAVRASMTETEKEVDSECEDSSRAPRAETMADADVERRARRRLELMRCDDVAQLLSLLVRTPASNHHPRSTASSSDEGRGDARMSTISDTSLLQARILIDTLAELLPSASQREVVRVTQALLRLYVELADAAFFSETADSARTFASAAAVRQVAFEVRRLLCGVGVLLANDAERFTTAQLVWLLSRLHTPRLRGVVAASTIADTKPITYPSSNSSSSSVTPTPATPAAAVVPSAADMTLDTSESFLSSAVARSLILVLADAPTSSAVSAAAATAPAEKVVTTGRWLTAVMAAELRPNSETVTELLTLIDASAL